MASWASASFSLLARTRHSKEQEGTGGWEQAGQKRRGGEEKEEGREGKVGKRRGGCTHLPVENSGHVQDAFAKL